MTRRRVNGKFAKEAVEEDTEPAMVPAAVGAPRLQSPRPRYCRVYARKRMAEAMGEIVDALVKQAKGGSVAHTKALAELSGLTKGGVVPKVVRHRGKSLAAEFLAEFED